MTIYELEAEQATTPLLNAYDRSSGTWSLPKEGEFWDAVAIAAGLGREGVDRRVAIIDSAFDISFPALARQNHVWSPVPGEATQHGTAVALLIHEVAPEATLDLYPAAINGHIDSGIAQQALVEISKSDADVINLSFGGLYHWKDVVTPTSENHRDDDFYASMRSFALDRKGRGEVDTQQLPLCQAAHTAIDTGKVVIAAIGNRNEYVYDPAIDNHVIACGFHTVRRQVRKGGDEVAWSDSPSFEQSIFNADMLIPQPPDVLGSSFASPLLAGFTALMSDPNQLPGFIESGRLAAIASSMLPDLPNQWSPDKHGVIDEIYMAAVHAVPHRHYQEPTSGPCPECALFARPAYVDFGLFKLNAGDLQGAEILLRTARQFAPACVPAAVNLGVTLLEKVKKNNMAGDHALSSLKEAKCHFEFAVEKYPDHEPYLRRLAEIENLLSAYRSQ